MGLVGMFTGSGEFHDFLTKLIENFLGVHGKGGDLHYDKNVNPQTIQKKMKRKGVHQEAQILSVNTENQIDENENVDVGGEGQEENVYRVPSPLTSQQQFQFVPSRTLPDDLEIRYPGSHPQTCDTEFPASITITFKITII